MTKQDKSTLDQATVQTNIRMPVRLRLRVDKYLQYMDLPLEERAPETDDWPDTLVGVISEAVDNFLVTHPQDKRSGPKGPRYKKPKPKPVPKKSPKGGE